MRRWRFSAVALLWRDKQFRWRERKVLAENNFRKRPRCFVLVQLAVVMHEQALHIDCEHH
jgi:hypothetical protein